VKKFLITGMLIASFLAMSGFFNVTVGAETRSWETMTSEDKDFFNTGNLVVARIIVKEMRGVRNHKDVRKHIRSRDRGKATVSGTGNRRVITGFYQWNNMRTGRPFGDPIKYRATVVKEGQYYHVCTLEQSYGPDYREWENLTGEFRLNLNSVCR
jgi:hypothetical protein